MKLTGTVMNASVENRELVNKDGQKRNSVITHVLLSSGEVGKDIEIINVRCFDAAFPLPQIGKSWTTPKVRKYECFSGAVADALVEKC